MKKNQDLQSTMTSSLSKQLETMNYFYTFIVPYPNALSKQIEENHATLSHSQHRKVYDQKLQLKEAS